MINECFISPNSIYVDLVEIITLTCFYMVYMTMSFFKYGGLFSNH